MLTHNKKEKIFNIEQIHNLSVDINNVEKYTDKCKVTCNICNTVFDMTVKQLIDPHPKREFTPCPICSAKEKFIRKMFEKYQRIPYEFLSEFKGYKEKINVKCKDCGFEFTTTASNLLTPTTEKRLHPCKKCIEESERKDVSILEEKLVELFGECNYEFPERKFAGIYSNKKIEIICKKCGHHFSTNPINIIQPKNGKHYCRRCNNKDRRLEGMTYYEKCQIFSGGKLSALEDFKSNRIAIKHKCNICGFGSNGEWKKLPLNNFITTPGCPKCANVNPQSKAEREILDFIKSKYNGVIIEKDKNILNGKELDIFLPDKNIAFEIDGLYFHNEEKKGRTYHKDKTIEAYNKGIRLVHIFDDEWYQKKDIVRRKIENIISVSSEKIYARKTKVVDIESSEKNIFLNKYHIQGADKATIKKALVFNNEIVAVMTLVKQRLSLGVKQKEEGIYELSRFATSKNVVGGFSKLLNHIILENEDIQKIITYADLRWSGIDKNVYTTNNFIRTHFSDPNYWYFRADRNAETTKREHRFNFRKQVLEKKFPEFFNKDLTEFQIMDKTNYKRIWDCGNIVFELIIKNKKEHIL